VQFKPAWETDAFRWSEICRKIRLELQRPIQQAALDLMDDCRGGNRPLVCVTGCRRAEGRTTVAMLLAHALAQAGLKVVLVGADPVNPDLTERLGVAIDSGWHPRLTTVQEVAECCVRSIADGFCFLPLNPQQCSASHLSTLAMSPLLELLANHFEAVVVDAGRLSSSPHSWPGNLLGAYVVVRDHRQTDSSAVEQLIGQLASAGPNAVRVVDNFAPRQGD
jgi:receptor protein-tyrosine kinase